MRSELERPPSRIGPRSSGWVRYAALFGVSFTVLIVCSSLAFQPSAFPAVRWAIGILAILAVIGASYGGFRLVNTGSLGSRFMASRGYSPGDPDSARRTADPEEVSAFRRYRRGEISRVDYERVLAYRRFVHGEVSKMEYHAIIARLDERQSRPPPRSGARA